MPVYIHQLIEDQAKLYISCLKCGRLVVVSGDLLLSKLGPQRPVRQVLHNLRCEKCGFLGDMTIKFNRDDLGRARQRLQVNPNDDWPSGIRDFVEVEAATDGVEDYMCNLCSMTAAVEAMRQLFKISDSLNRLGNAEPLPAIWPKYKAPVVRLTPDGERELTMMKWGFLTQKLSQKTGKPISPAAWNNARADKVQTNGLWRESFYERRCLVPATSFREAKGRRPATDYWFALKGDEPRPLFAFAGLWRHHQPQLRDDTQNTDTHTIITTTPNELVKTVHPDRMPVILDPSDYETWLTGTPTEAISLLKPFPSERMQIVRQGIGELADPLES